MGRRGEIDVMVAGQHAARLSREEAAQLAEMLWKIGSTTNKRGAIAIAGALKAAAHKSLVTPTVDVRSGDVSALHQALGELPPSAEDAHGLEDLGAAVRD